MWIHCIILLNTCSRIWDGYGGASDQVALVQAAIVKLQATMDAFTGKLINLDLNDAAGFDESCKMGTAAAGLAALLQGQKVVFLS